MLPPMSSNGDDTNDVLKDELTDRGMFVYLFFLERGMLIDLGSY
jgi:hypothetical protein